MARISKDPEERKMELLDAAEELFRTKGYEDTSISNIVKKIGVAQGTFYYYFTSKDEIADSIIKRSIESLVKPLYAIASMAEMNAIQKLSKMIEEDFKLRNLQGDSFQYLHHSKNDSLHQKFIIKLIMEYTPILTEIIKQGVEEGSFKTDFPKEIAEFFLTGFQFLFDPGIFHWSKDEFISKLKATNEIVEKLLGVQKGTFHFSFLKQG